MYAYNIQKAKDHVRELFKDIFWEPGVSSGQVSFLVNVIPKTQALNHVCMISEKPQFIASMHHY